MCFRLWQFQYQEKVDQLSVEEVSQRLFVVEETTQWSSLVEVIELAQVEQLPWDLPRQELDPEDENGTELDHEMDCHIHILYLTFAAAL